MGSLQRVKPFSFFLFQPWPKAFPRAKPKGLNGSSPSLVLSQAPFSISWKPDHPGDNQTVRGLKPIVSCGLQCGLLVPVISPYSTPILPLQKTNGTHGLVQDCCAINQIILPIHLIMPNWFALLSSVASSTTHDSGMDLKDSFFTTPLNYSSQPPFASTSVRPLPLTCSLSAHVSHLI